MKSQNREVQKRRMRALSAGPWARFQKRMGKGRVVSRCRRSREGSPHYVEALILGLLVPYSSIWYHTWYIGMYHLVGTTWYAIPPIAIWEREEDEESWDYGLRRLLNCRVTEWQQWRVHRESGDRFYQRRWGVQVDSVQALVVWPHAVRTHVRTIMVLINMAIPNGIMVYV
jgi:hypothetical protein